jgi:hypothetical protein
MRTFSLIALFILTTACTADTLDSQDSPAPNVLHEDSGLCGHPGEPCCLPAAGSHNFDSYCVTDSACIGADLSCEDADGADGATPGPQCGVCGATEKKYKYFCDAAYLLIEKQCAWDVACGFHDASYLDVCVAFFSAIADGRCSVPITSTDAQIDECLAGWDGLSCTDPMNMPAACDGFFFSKQ